MNENKSIFDIKTPKQLKLLKIAIVFFSVFIGVLSTFFIGHDAVSKFLTFVIFSGLTGYSGFFMYVLIKAKNGFYND